MRWGKFNFRGVSFNSAGQWVSWAVRLTWWALTEWLPYKAWWTWYFARWDYDMRWCNPRLHRKMWRYYQRTGCLMITNR